MSDAHHGLVPAPIQVGLVGAGRLARALAQRICADTDLVAVSRHVGRLARPSGQPDLVVSTDPADAAGASLVLLAVPTEEIVPAARWLVPWLAPDAVLVNMATDLATASVAAQLPGRRVIGCKVVGQAAEIGFGSSAALVVSGATAPETRLVEAALAGVGTVVEADETLAAQVNELVARRIIAARAALVDELDRLAVPDVIARAAIGNAAVGILRALSNGTAGPYLRRIASDFVGS